MNLTEEQAELLKTLVEIRDSGQKGSFIFIETLSSGNHLVYGYPSQSIAAPYASELDFRQLQTENLITFTILDANHLTGQLTQNGIDLVHSWSQPSSDATISGSSKSDAQPLVTLASGLPSNIAVAALGKLRMPPPTYVEKRGPVFIGHGHREDWRALKDFLEQLNIDCLHFERESPAGIWTHELVEEMRDKANFAFLVMTAEDEQKDGTFRARENVIEEAGLFRDKLGPRKAILVVEEGCSIPSNLAGLNHIRFPKGWVKASFTEVREVLQRERIIS